MHEAKCYEDNCFLTLTYNDMWLPWTKDRVFPTLRREDLTKFMKRLRKHVEPRKIRFFYCGEYGGKGARPHYHVIVFNWKPDDLYFFKRDKSGEVLYRSPIVERLWSYLVPNKEGDLERISIGFSSVGDLTFNSARYCAKYLQKFQQMPKQCVPAFTGASNRPGIGYFAISPEILFKGGIYKNGRKYPIPRYYMKVLSESHDLDDYKDFNYQVNHFRQMIQDPYHKFSVKKGKKLLEKLLTKK